LILQALRVASFFWQIRGQQIADFPWCLHRKLDGRHGRGDGEQDQERQ
jgi:hypothetical protein